MHWTKILFLLIISITGQFIYAQDMPQSVNSRDFPEDSVRQSYIFYAAGHLYGSAKNLDQTWPSRNFFSAIFPINLDPTHFFIGMGDLTPGLRPEVELQNFSLITDQMNVPFINAPGNHDLRNREIYKRHFYFEETSFEYGPDLFLILNTESMLESWKGTNMTTILDGMLDQYTGKSFRNVFVLAHRPFWILPNERLSYLNDCLNEPMKIKMELVSETVSRILSIAGDARIYWFGGDIGKMPFPTTFYDEDPDGRQFYVICGLGDRIEDALTRIKVNEDGMVDISFKSLTMSTPLKKSDFGTEAWKNSLADNPPRIDGKKPKAAFYEAYQFWNGLVVGLIIGILITIALVKVSRKRIKD